MSIPSYHAHTATDDRQFMTPSPSAQQDDSYDDDDHTPPRRSSGTNYTTPSWRSKSSTSGIPIDVRNALHALYEKIYGPKSQKCLLTLCEGGIQVAHAVQRAR